ncbi:MAG: ABC transporter substrate-binding protein [Candidatus Hydrogenedentota bacterium]
MQRFLIFVLIVHICAFVTGCGPAPENPAGREGVITLAPNITETVFTLGAGDQVIGRTSFCHYPAEVEEIPAVGGYIDPDLEKMTRLRPELIMLQGRHEKVAEFAQRNGIATVHVDMDSLATIDSGIETIGEALGREAEAQALREAIAADLEAVREAVADKDRPRVFLVSARSDRNLQNLPTMGADSFVSELVDIAGGANVYADAGRTYVSASKERLVMREPEAILEFQPGADLDEQEVERLKADWDAMPSLPAVQNGRIHVIQEEFALTPGPRVAELARLLAEILHPDVDLPEKAKSE